MTLPSALVSGRPWWRRFLDRVLGRPHIFVSCARCGNLLGKPPQPWRRGERSRTECFRQADIAAPGEPPYIVCIKLEHIRYYA